MEAKPTSSGELYRELQRATEEFNRVVDLADSVGLEVVAELLPVQTERRTALRPVLIAKLCTS